MANDDHIALLKKGVAAWNAWREENPNIRPDLSEANLIGANLREANFGGVNLREALLLEANFHRANLRDADLSRANLKLAIFIGANLEGANLEGANLEGANLEGANLEGAQRSDIADLLTSKEGPRIVVSFVTEPVIAAQRQTSADALLFWPAAYLPTNESPVAPRDVVLGFIGYPDEPPTSVVDTPLATMVLGVVAAGRPLPIATGAGAPAYCVPLIVAGTIPKLDGPLPDALAMRLVDAVKTRWIDLPKSDLRFVAPWLRDRLSRPLPFNTLELAALSQRTETPAAALSRLGWSTDPDSLAQLPWPPFPGAPARPRELDAYVPFREDAPLESEDELDRGPLALFLARRLHLIWCQMNGYAPTPRRGTTKPPERAAGRISDAETFIVHIDSPWGGGKTTFANLVAEVLNPRSKLPPNHFLRTMSILGGGESFDEIFLANPGAGDTERNRWPPAARVPWIVARYNAWRDQYVYPPWWHVFLTIESAIRRELRVSARRNLPSWRGWKALVRAYWWNAGIRFEKLWYLLWNAKMRKQLLVLALTALLVLGLWKRGLFVGIQPKERKEWIDFVVAVLGFGGVSIAAVFAVISQSFVPDLDFTAEHKQVGVRDPIGRFRGAFGRILRRAHRPVLLIVDDIDRCEAEGVVEILRGFQTIIRSPRLVVLMLGDRSWIEMAHEIHHKDFAGIVVGSESRLGARFVEKMFQLSFTLPAMTADVRDRFTRAVLAGRTASASGDQQSNLEGLVADLQQLVVTPSTVADREERARKLADKAVSGGASKHDATAVANLALVASAASDPDYQGEMLNALSQLATSLPGNPRQIKRIVNAFAVYETVGRLFFNYQLTADEVDRESLVKARRWRQLAIWVTLATEWPDTWRMLARMPSLIDAAYAEDEAARESLRKSLVDGESSDAEREAVRNVLHRLIHDYALVRLLSAPKLADVQRASGEAIVLAEAALEPAAIFEFNRIMWEPGFVTHSPDSTSESPA